MRKISISVVVLVLSGCVTTKGPTQIINSKGVATELTSIESLTSKFRESHDSAYRLNTQAAANVMVREGFALVKANCNEYFWSAGETQKWLLFSRDTLGAVGTVVSGILALHSGKTNSAGYFAIATGAGLAGLDIYTKNFLFSAENISSVQTLTNNALSTHADAVLNAKVEDYSEATTALIANQNICAPMYIASLAREAIKNGKVVATAEVLAENDLSIAQDQLVLERLGHIIGQPGPITMTQAGGYWWLYKHFSSESDRKNLILKMFLGIPEKNIPLNLNGEPKENFASSQVIEELNKFSQKAKSTFDKKIDEVQSAERVSGTENVAAGVSGTSAPVEERIPPEFQAPIGQRRTSTNFSIKVQ